jgi:hypothetical protein
LKPIGRKFWSEFRQPNPKYVKGSAYFPKIMAEPQMKGKPLPTLLEVCKSCGQKQPSGRIGKSLEETALALERTKRASLLA